MYGISLIIWLVRAWLEIFTGNGFPKLYWYCWIVNSQLGNYYEAVRMEGEVLRMNLVKARHIVTRLVSMSPRPWSTPFPPGSKSCWKHHLLKLTLQHRHLYLNLLSSILRLAQTSLRWYCRGGALFVTVISRSILMQQMHRPLATAVPGLQTKPTAL